MYFFPAKHLPTHFSANFGAFSPSGVSFSPDGSFFHQLFLPRARSLLRQAASDRSFSRSYQRTFTQPPQHTHTHTHTHTHRPLKTGPPPPPSTRLATSFPQYPPGLLRCTRASSAHSLLTQALPRKHKHQITWFFFARWGYFFAKGGGGSLFRQAGVSFSPT